MKTTALNEKWDVLVRFFPEGWDEKAYECQALVRKRGFDSPELLMRLLLIHLAGGRSLRSAVSYAKTTQLCEVSDVSLLKRLRSSGEWFRWLCRQLRAELDHESDFTVYSRLFRIRTLDASVIRGEGPAGSSWRLHYSLNLESLRCDSCFITAQSVGENFTHFQVGPGDLLIGDRAYCRRKGIFSVLEAGGDVLVRFHSTNLPLLTRRGRHFGLLEKLNKLKAGQVGDWDVYYTDAAGRQAKGRICAIRKSRETIDKSIKQLKMKASRQQRSLKPETLELARFFIVFTSVNRHKLKGSDALWLYRKRWQVELAFKRLKSIVELGHLPKRDPDSCIAWLHGKLFVALLVERIFQEAENFSPWGYPLHRPAHT
jgi:hypothetical protein